MSKVVIYKGANAKLLNKGGIEFKNGVRLTSDSINLHNEIYIQPKGSLYVDHENLVVYQAIDDVGGWRVVSRNPYKGEFLTTDWVVDGLRFKIEIPPGTHKQGTDVNLFVATYDNGTLLWGESDVSVGGVVTIFSDIAYNGTVIISDSGLQISGNVITATELASLTDVDLTGLTDGQIIIWNEATNKFIPFTLPDSGATELADLTDVDLTGLADGQVLVWDEATSKFVPFTVSGGGGATELADLTDVDLTGLVNGQVLIWDEATSKFIPATISGGGIPEAPADGKLYGRKNASWEEAVDLVSDQVVAGSKTLVDTLQIFDEILGSQVDDGSRLTVSHVSNSPNVDNPVHMKLYSAPVDMQPTEINHGIVSSSTVGSSYAWTQTKYRDKPAVDPKENMDFTELAQLAGLGNPTIDGSTGGNYGRRPILATNGLMYFTPATSYMVSFNPTTLEQVKINFPSTIGGTMQHAYDVNTNRIYLFNENTRQVFYYDITSSTWTNFGSTLTAIVSHSNGALVLDGSYLYVVYIDGSFQQTDGRYHRIALADGSSEILTVNGSALSGYIGGTMYGSPLLLDGKFYSGMGLSNCIGCLDLVSGVATASESSTTLNNCTVIGVIDGDVAITQRDYYGTNYPPVAVNLSTLTITSTYSYPVEMVGVLEAGDSRIGYFGYADEENKKFYRLTGLRFNDGVDRIKPAIEVLDYVENTWSFIDLGDKLPEPHANRSGMYTHRWMTKDSVGTIVGCLYVDSSGDAATSPKGYMFTMLPINTAGVGDVKPVYKLNPDGGTVEVGDINKPDELALKVNGRTQLSPRADVGLQSLNNGVLRVWGTAEVSQTIKAVSSIQFGNNSNAASEALKGSMRYWEDAEHSYVDVCMITADGPAWVNIVTSSFTNPAPPAPEQLAADFYRGYHTGDYPNYMGKISLMQIRDGVYTEVYGNILTDSPPNGIGKFTTSVDGHYLAVDSGGLRVYEGTPTLNDFAQVTKEAPTHYVFTSGEPKNIVADTDPNLVVPHFLVYMWGPGGMTTPFYHIKVEDSLVKVSADINPGDSMLLRSKVSNYVLTVSNGVKVYTYNYANFSSPFTFVKNIDGLTGAYSGLALSNNNRCLAVYASGVIKIAEFTDSDFNGSSVLGDTISTYVMPDPVGSPKPLFFNVANSLNYYLIWPDGQALKIIKIIPGVSATVHQEFYANQSISAIVCSVNYIGVSVANSTEGFFVIAYDTETDTFSESSISIPGESYGCSNVIPI